MKKRSDFATQKEFLSYLVKNKRELTDFKKASLKFTEPFISDSSAPVIKALGTAFVDDVTTGVIKRTIIGNTYNWMDSVNDVLLDNVFQKSIAEHSDKVWHLHDHQHMITAKVGKPTSIYEKKVSWKDLGVNKEGQTMSLFMDSNIIKDYNPLVFQQYLTKEINQHSVGMRYVQLDLAVNDEEMKQEFSTWNKYIDLIGNKEKTLEDGYFWAVKEGKLAEISAVLAGANELTPTVDNKSFVQNDVQETKEEKGAAIDFKYLRSNFKL